MKNLGFILILGVAFTSCNQTDLDGLKEQRKTLKEEFKEYSKEYTIALNKLDSTINVHPDNKVTVTSINKVPVTITTVQRKTFEHFFEVHGNVEAKENAAIEEVGTATLRVRQCRLAVCGEPVAVDE